MQIYPSVCFWYSSAFFSCLFSATLNCSRLPLSIFFLLSSDFCATVVLLLSAFLMVLLYTASAVCFLFSFFFNLLSPDMFFSNQLVDNSRQIVPTFSSKCWQKLKRSRVLWEFFVLFTVFLCSDAIFNLQERVADGSFSFLCKMLIFLFLPFLNLGAQISWP